MKTTGKKSEKKALLSWLWVFLCTLAIFLTVPAARSIQRYVSAHWGRSLFGYVVLAVLCAGFLALIYALIFKLKNRGLSSYVWLFLIGGLYLYFTIKLWGIPEEAIHFLEYGALSFFLFRAISHHVKDRSIYFTVTFFVLLIGTGDEIYQWITPERIWDFRDVGLNMLAGGLFQMAVWKIIRPGIISEKFNRQSLRWLTAAVAISIMALGLCLSNTPDRVGKYTSLLPALSSLQKEESMSEYGYRHEDPDIGAFHSRFSKEALRQLDGLNGSRHAKLLNQTAGMSYQDFIAAYHPISAPFLYEVRIHIFRRGRYFKDAETAKDLAEKKSYYTVACKENLLLEKYFSKSIRNTVYQWDEAKREACREFSDRSVPYVSPVSAELITSFNEKNVWALILIILAGLGILNLYYSLRKKQGS